MAIDRPMKYMRVKMLISKSVETTPGSFVHFQAGEIYLIPAYIAEQWIEEGSAIDPNVEEGGK